MPDGPSAHDEARAAGFTDEQIERGQRMVVPRAEGEERWTDEQVEAALRSWEASRGSSMSDAEMVALMLDAAGAVRASRFEEVQQELERYMDFWRLQRGRAERAEAERDEALAWKKGMQPVPCPEAEVCKSCPCAGEDDVCFPGERLRADLERAQEALRGLTAKPTRSKTEGPEEVTEERVREVEQKLAAYKLAEEILAEARERGEG